MDGPSELGVARFVGRDSGHRPGDARVLSPLRLVNRDEDAANVSRTHPSTAFSSASSSNVRRAGAGARTPSDGPSIAAREAEGDPGVASLVRRGAGGGALQPRRSAERDETRVKLVDEGIDRGPPRGTRRARSTDAERERLPPPRKRAGEAKPTGRRPMFPRHVAQSR